jgi:hypothetical protein
LVLMDNKEFWHNVGVSSCISTSYIFKFDNLLCVENIYP